ncbi:hypothetical protein Belba_2727 [Belliella baltica DSM 15883]|uniref:Uncharacterized protein n=1 Tax=Belliella baltica (strain DSM 15883 / CIP 108006 / LMG 21964 / BA134) TaxID=866536 RepID=I3Z7Q2_BELBD|nr:hypothetical protein Belba_2727 [Belliella baltica DSM 15883]
MRGNNPVRACPDERSDFGRLNLWEWDSKKYKSVDAPDSYRGLRLEVTEHQGSKGHPFTWSELMVWLPYKSDYIKIY